MSNILNVVGNPIITESGMTAIARGLLDATRVWSSGVKPPKLHLYNDDVPLTPQTVLGDLTECTFTGYLAVTLDALVNVLDVDDVPTVENTDTGTFTADDPLTLPGQAAGYYWTDNESTHLIAVERFPDVFPVNDPGDIVNIIARIKLPGLTPS